MVCDVSGIQLGGFQDAGSRGTSSPFIILQTSKYVYKLSKSYSYVNSLLASHQLISNIGPDVTALVVQAVVGTVVNASDVEQGADVGAPEVDVDAEEGAAEEAPSLLLFSPSFINL